MAKTLHIVVSTHQGVLYNDDCEMATIISENGNFGILPDHIETIATIKDGFIKLVANNEAFYLCIVNASIHFKNNILDVIAQEAMIGRDMDKSREELLEVRRERLERNRKQVTEFSISEKELMDSIKKAHVGGLKK